MLFYYRSLVIFYHETAEKYQVSENILTCLVYLLYAAPTAQKDLNETHVQ